MKTVKGLFLILLCSLSAGSYSQDQRIKFSLQSGFMNGAAIYCVDKDATESKEEGGWNAGFDISYFLTNRFFLSAHINMGELRYRANVMDVTSYTYLKGVRGPGEMKIINIAWLAGYCLPLSELLNVTGQAGFGVFYQVDAYPFRLYFPDEYIPDRYRPQTWSIGSDFFSFSFPVKFTVGITPFKRSKLAFAENFEIAYALGFYIEPDFGVFTGVYHGPQLSIRF
jgi:hypothetical protein